MTPAGYYGKRQGESEPPPPSKKKKSNTIARQGDRKRQRWESNKKKTLNCMCREKLPFARELMPFHNKESHMSTAAVLFQVLRVEKNR